MRKPIITLMLSALVASTAVWADDQITYHEQDTQSPGTTADPSMTTSAESSEITRGYLANEFVGIKPQVGVVAFTDQFGNTQGRGALGLTAESNIANMVGLKGTNLYTGVVTGFIFSHLGDPGSNLFGSNSDTPVGNGGANMFFIPANAKVGYNLTDQLRVAAHGGGNVIYRSIGTSMSLGTSSNTTGSVWRIFPNVGGDVEYAVGQNVAVMLRPDWTLTPGDTMFTGTVALNIAMG